jgi:beta-phosphoglucomutase
MADPHEALVFDFDGVIADTEPLHWKSWAVLLARFGLPLSWEQYCRIGIGVSDEQIYEHFRKLAPVPGADEFSHLNNERRQMVRELSLKQHPVPQETVVLLKSLSHYRVGLVTSSGRSEVEPVLLAAGIHDRFDAMVFGEDVTACKPSPEPYLLIAQKLGIQAGIAFEDSRAGLKSAESAGFKAVRIQRPADLSRIVAQWLK